MSPTSGYIIGSLPDFPRQYSLRTARRKVMLFLFRLQRQFYEAKPEAIDRIDY